MIAKLAAPPSLFLDALGLERMSSGHVCLNLSERVTWQQFPAYAESVLRVTGGKRTRVAESVELRIWDVSFLGATVSLVWSDYPEMVSLESSSTDGDLLLSQIFTRLQPMVIATT